MGGVGKTELALQYAYSRLSSYPAGICWLRARGNIGTELAAFARDYLGLRLPEEIDDTELLRLCWKHWPSGEVLLFFDDAPGFEEVEPYLPPTDRSRFGVLVTTRRKRLAASFEELCLDVLEETAALKLLGALSSPARIEAEIESAKAICAFLGGLPLGLELVGRYLARKEDLSLATLLERLEDRGLEQRALSHPEPDQTTRRGISGAFELSWEELSEQPESRKLACLLSLFGQAPFAWRLVETAWSGDDEELEAIRDELLLSLHLLKRREQGMYELHPLLRSYFRGKLQDHEESEALKAAFCRAMVEEASRLPQNPTRQQQESIAPAIPHLRDAAECWSDGLSDEELVWPFVALGWFHEGRGQYGEAEHWWRTCLARTERRFAPEHPTVATSMNSLATLLQATNRLSEAEPLMRRAFEILEASLGPEHPNTKIVAGNLERLLGEAGKPGLRG